MQRFARPFALALAALITGCDRASVPDDAPTPKPRWEYTQEDFSIGKPHTKNARCNREIDALLEPIRACYNTHEQTGCTALQAENSKKIARLKNARRCQK